MPKKKAYCKRCGKPIYRTYMIKKYCKECNLSGRYEGNLIKI